MMIRNEITRQLLYLNVLEVLETTEQWLRGTQVRSPPPVSLQELNNGRITRPQSSLQNKDDVAITLGGNRKHEVSGVSNTPSGPQHFFTAVLSPECDFSTKQPQLDMHMYFSDGFTKLSHPNINFLKIYSDRVSQHFFLTVETSHNH